MGSQKKVPTNPLKKGRVGGQRERERIAPRGGGGWRWLGGWFAFAPQPFLAFACPSHRPPIHTLHSTGDHGGFARGGHVPVGQCMVAHPHTRLTDCEPARGGSFWPKTSPQACRWACGPSAPITRFRESQTAGWPRKVSCYPQVRHEWPLCANGPGRRRRGHLEATLLLYLNSLVINARPGPSVVPFKSAYYR